MKLVQDGREPFAFFFKTFLQSHQHPNYLELRSDVPDLCAYLMEETLQFREFWVLTIHDRDSNLVKVVLYNPDDELVIMDTTSMKEAMLRLATYIYLHMGRGIIPLIYVVCGATNMKTFNYIMEVCMGTFHYFGPHSELFCHKCRKQRVVMGFNCADRYLEYCIDHMPYLNNTLGDMHLLPRSGCMVFTGLGHMNDGNVLRVSSKYWDIGTNRSLDLFSVDASKLEEDRFPDLVALVHAQSLFNCEIGLPTQETRSPLRLWKDFISFFCPVRGEDDEYESLIDALRSVTKWCLSTATSDGYDTAAIYEIEGDENIFGQQPQLGLHYTELQERYYEMVNSPDYILWLGELECDDANYVRNILTQIF